MLELLIRAKCLLLQCAVIGGFKESRHYCNWMHDQAWYLDWYFEQLSVAVPDDIDLSGKLVLAVDVGALESRLLETLNELGNELNSAARLAFASDLVAFTRLTECLVNLTEFTQMLATKLEVRDFIPVPCEVI